jgi:HxlR-like helix-turn-helix
VGPRFAKELIEGLLRDRGFDGCKTWRFGFVVHSWFSLFSRFPSVTESKMGTAREQEGTFMSPRDKHVSGKCLAVREVLNRVGDKWSVQVVALLGDGKKRFSELRRSIEGISQRMLTLTLKGLQPRRSDHQNGVSHHPLAR